MIIDYKHYIEILKKHDKERTPYNDRLKYWEEYCK
jgi:hypothetical protein|tara:strand:+ start:428 stop:532 length:105 start_codon:yes stop_codon:yes gene_type:complete